MELRSLLLAIAGITLLAAATDQLMPSGRGKQTMSLIVGLLLLLCLVTPITRLLGKVPEEIASAEVLRMDAAYASQTLAGGDGVYGRQIVEVWERQVEAAVKKIAQRHALGTVRVAIAWGDEGALSGLSVLGAEESGELREEISAATGIEPALITFAP